MDIFYITNNYIPLSTKPNFFAIFPGVLDRTDPAIVIKEAILHELVHEICLVILIKDSVQELKLFTVSTRPGRPDLIRSLTACSLHITQDVSCHFELARDVEKLILFFLLVPIEVAELDCIPFQ